MIKHEIENEQLLIGAAHFYMLEASFCPDSNSFVLV